MHALLEGVCFDQQACLWFFIMEQYIGGTDDA